MAKKKIKILALLISAMLSLNVLTACDFVQKIVGDAVCLTCMDEQTIKCTDCKGKKQRTCSMCLGIGYTNCSLCFGTGRRTCTMCGGMGSRYEYDFYSGGYTYKTCFSCVLGYTTCIATYNCSCVDGKNNCYKCDENGEIPCPDCTTED